MPTPPVAQVTAALKPTAVNAILAEMSELKRSGRDVVSLMRGEPDLPTPAPIVAACQQALADGLVVKHRATRPEMAGHRTAGTAVALTPPCAAASFNGTI